MSNKNTNDFKSEDKANNELDIKGADAIQTEKAVTFYLNEQIYALMINEVQEINRVSEITHVPNSPTHILGVINLRGKIVPVMELKKRLNLGEKSTNETVKKLRRIVVVELGSKVMGLLVDRVAEVRDLDKTKIEEAPAEVVDKHLNFVRGVCMQDDKMIILLNLIQVIAQGTGVIQQEAEHLAQ